MSILRKLLSIVVIVVLLLSAFLGESRKIYAKSNNEEEQKVILKSEIIVKYKNKIEIETEEIMKKVKNNLKMKKLNLKRILKYKNTELVEIDESDDIFKAIEEFEKDPNVEYAQPNYILSTCNLPEDKGFNEQWALRNVSQTMNGIAGVEGVDIDAVSAWDITIGSEDIVVGIIDTGIDIKHLDLKESIYININEIADNGIDDDGNGFIDDINGYDFINEDNSVYDSSSNDKHGTHIAGIIAANLNEEGVVGIAPKVKILPLKVINGTYGYTSDVIEAIEYARTMGIRIVNCSWGGSDYNTILRDIMNESGILFVCASGNSGRDVSLTPIYPANFNIDNIISVASINNMGNLSSFSNYGLGVDVAAPGEDIISTLPDDTYGYMSGTSMATPYVTGIASLLLAQNSVYSINDLKSIILSSTFTQAYSTNNENLSIGIVNAYRALGGIKQEDNKGDIEQLNEGLLESDINNTEESDNSKLYPINPYDFYNYVFKTESYILKLKVHSNGYFENRVIEYSNEKVAEILSANIDGLEVKAVEKFGTEGIFLITFDQKISNTDLLNALNRKGIGDIFEYIHPDYEFTLESIDSPLDRHNTEKDVEEEETLNVKKVLSPYEVKINHNITLKSKGSVVAVIDTGIDITHQEIMDCIWINRKEIAENGVDDDKNGYIDDVYGFNFNDNNENIHDADKIFDEWHGTQVAGVISGYNSDSEKGVKNQNRIMVLKVFDRGIARTSNIIRAIEYASKMGARIANCSFSSQYENLALEHVMKQYDLLFVCASGNNCSNIDEKPVYPAAYNLPNVISAGSVSRNGTLSKFSNFSEKAVDITAPGEDVNIILPSNNYGTNSGTSLSAAYVSTEAALLFGMPNAKKASEVKEVIINTADRLSSLEGKIKRGNLINMQNAILGVTNNDLVTVVEEINNGSIDNKNELSTFSTGAWMAKTNMLSTRGDSGCTVVNNKAYIIGGFFSNKNEMYDPVTDSWMVKASMPEFRAGIGVEAVNDKIYVIGGWTYDYNTQTYSILNKVEEYNPATNTWSIKANMPTKRENFATAVYQNKIYVIGGSSDTGWLNVVEVFDPITNTWETKASMPTARCGFRATTIGDKIYAAGGFYCNKLEVYNISKNTWTTKASMLNERSCLGIESINGKLFAIGGRNTSGNLNTVEEYNPYTDSWSYASCITVARDNFPTTTIDNKIYTFGGYNSSWLNIVEEFSIDTIDSEVESFESGFNIWNNESGDDVDWSREMGSTPSNSSGPISACDGNYYIYIESTSPNYPNKSAYLNGPNVNYGDIVSFKYHMYGSDMGTLKLEGYNGTSWVNIWEKTGNQGDEWHKENVILPLEIKKIRFEGITGIGDTSNMALDEIIVYGNESFEYGLNSWANESGDNIDWSLNLGSTQSLSTGPSSAYDENYYVYVEASSPNYPSKKAYLTRTHVNYGDKINFYYHMYGLDMGSLKLQGYDGAEWLTIWERTGDQGNEWHEASVLILAGISKLRFEGITGSSYRGDMALDNISVYQEPEVQLFTVSASIANDAVSVSYSTIKNILYYEIEIDGEIINNGIETTYTQSFLEVGVNHTVRVRPVNESGYGLWSETITLGAPPDFTYEYNQNGRLIYIKDDQGDILLEFIYDNNGNLKNKIVH